MTLGDQLQYQTQIGILIRSQTQSQLLYSFFATLWTIEPLARKIKPRSFNYNFHYNQYSDRFSHQLVVDGQVIDERTKTTW